MPLRGAACSIRRMTKRTLKAISISLAESRIARALSLDVAYALQTAIDAVLSPNEPEDLADFEADTETVWETAVVFLQGCIRQVQSATDELQARGTTLGLHVSPMPTRPPLLDSLWHVANYAKHHPEWDVANLSQRSAATWTKVQQLGMTTNGVSRNNVQTAIESLAKTHSTSASVPDLVVEIQRWSDSRIAVARSWPV